MATFEPTDAEKAAASYLDWDDAELGKFTKYCGLVMAENRKDAEGLHRVAASSCAMQLVGACIDSNAADLKLELTNHTHKGVSTGDWVLTLKRKPKRRSPALLPQQDETQPARNPCRFDTTQEKT